MPPGSHWNTLHGRRPSLTHHPLLLAYTGEKRVNRLVFIGRNLDRQALVASFKACIVKSYTVKRK